MTSAQRIEIVTIYNAARTTGGRTRVRALAAMSLLFAAFWLYQTQGQLRLSWLDGLAGGTTVHNWLGVRVGAAIISAGSVGMEASTNPWAAIGLAPADNKPPSEEMKAKIERGQRQGAILAVERQVWEWIVQVAGAWLVVAGLVGLTGRRIGLTMLRQAAYLMIFSTVASVAGIYIAIHWGGMPPDATLPFYAKIAGVQSAYAWFLLIVTRLFR